MFTSTEFKTNLFYRHKTTHYALKHLILFKYRVKLCMTIKYQVRSLSLLTNVTSFNLASEEAVV